MVGATALGGIAAGGGAAVIRSDGAWADGFGLVSQPARAIIATAAQVSTVINRRRGAVPTECDMKGLLDAADDGT
jgi:hypothetical protein